MEKYYKFNNKKVSLKGIDFNIYPQETLEATIFSKILETNVFNEIELKEISLLSSQTFMLNIY